MTLKILSYISGVLAVILMIFYFWVYDRTTREVLQVLWVESPYATDFRNVLDEFTDVTNISVNVESVPRELYREVIERDLDEGTAQFDLVIGDTVWMFKDIRRGYYADISQNIKDSWLYSELPDSLRFGLVESPSDSGVYYGMPVVVNGFALAYRSDLFTDPAHGLAFEQQYGYPLTPPQSLAQLQDASEYFDGIPELSEGISYMSLGNDGALSNTFFALAAAQGISFDNLRSAQRDVPVPGIQTLEHMKYVTRFAANHDPYRSAYTSTLNAFKNGEVAMVIGSFEMMRQLHKDTMSNTEAISQEQIEYSVLPGIEERSDFISMYSIARVAASPNTRASDALLDWWGTLAAQEFWYEEGEYPLIPRMLNSNVMQENMPPYFPAFTQSLMNPQHFFLHADNEILLQLSDTYLGGYIQGRGEFSAEETLNIIRKAWIDVF